MAAAAAEPRSPPGLLRADGQGMNTLPDPRSPSPASFFSRGSSPGSVEHHPDLTNEVAALSTKLVNAINHQTALDDSLQEARHELNGARTRLAQLERAAKEHEQLISQGLLVKKDEVERRHVGLYKDIGGLREQLQQERQQRELAEKEKKRIESELETLTASLFEEANTMVASARKETESANHRIELLKNQVRDTETLLSSQQEQLHDLKVVMQQMSDRDESEAATHISSAPSTPGLPPGKLSRIFDAANMTPVTPSVGGEPDPQPPLHFQQLLAPVLRSDLPAFQDFQSLLRTAKEAAAAHSAASSRNPSGNYSGLNSMSVGLGSATNLVHTHSFATHAASTPPLTPTLPPRSKSSTGSPRDSINSPQPALPPLKESKYFKRVLPEDIEPTLRLDLAPGLSWLNKRSILQGATSGSLTIEPAPAPVARNYGPVFPCALCGENGKQERYARRHQFRVADDGEAEVVAGIKAKAQRWPLCDWCLSRVRATCDFVAFLKLCQAGVWKADTPERAREAWEEGVRLRERMFWARVGGGVVPSFAGHHHFGEAGGVGVGGSSSGKTPPEDEQRQQQQHVKPEKQTPPALPRRTNTDGSSKAGDEVSPFNRASGGEKRVSIGRTVIERKDSAAWGEESDNGQPATAEVASGVGKPPALPPRGDTNGSTDGDVASDATTGHQPPGQERLSSDPLAVTIPGAFSPPTK